MLKAEKARADRRAELGAIIATPLTVASATTEQVRDADPGAASLSVYLTALGLAITPDLLSRWLVLVPVLALEVGSGLAGVLVQALAPPSAQVAKFSRPNDVSGASKFQKVVHVVHADETGPSDERDRVKAALLDHLKTKGGSVAQSERGLAALIGASRPTVRRAINGLTIAGIVAAEATRQKASSRSLPIGRVG